MADGEAHDIDVEAGPEFDGEDLVVRNMVTPMDAYRALYQDPRLHAYRNADVRSRTGQGPRLARDRACAAPRQPSSRVVPPREGWAPLGARAQGSGGRPAGLSPTPEQTTRLRNPATLVGFSLSGAAAARTPVLLPGASVRSPKNRFLRCRIGG